MGVHFSKHEKQTRDDAASNVTFADTGPTDYPHLTKPPSNYPFICLFFPIGQCLDCDYYGYKWDKKCYENKKGSVEAGVAADAATNANSTADNNIAILFNNTDLSSLKVPDEATCDLIHGTWTANGCNVNLKKRGDTSSSTSYADTFNAGFWNPNIMIPAFVAATLWLLIFTVSGYVVVKGIRAKKHWDRRVVGGEKEVGGSKLGGYSDEDVDVDVDVDVDIKDGQIHSPFVQPGGFVFHGEKEVGKGAKYSDKDVDADIKDGQIHFGFVQPGGCDFGRHGGDGKVGV